MERNKKNKTNNHKTIIGIDVKQGVWTFQKASD